MPNNVTSTVTPEITYMNEKSAKERDDVDCYKHGGNWDECAGDHLMYPKSTAKELYARPFMCLFEPFCWKQLDWQRTLPPVLDLKDRCPLSRDLTFYDWSLHDGTMASLSTQIEVSMAEKLEKDLKVYSCSVKRAKASKRNYHYDFKLCDEQNSVPFIDTWVTRATDEMAKKYFEWFKRDANAQAVDAHIIAFLPNFFDWIMSFNRTIIVNPEHRINMYRCSYNETMQNFNNLKRLASSGKGKRFPNGPSHIIGPGYVHEIEYIRHYLGLRKLIYLPMSFLSVLKYAIGDASYSGENGKYIWNSYDQIPEELSKYEIEPPTKYELSDLLKYRAAIILPYSVTNTKSAEQYEMNIPMFAPTPEFAVQLGMFSDRTATYDVYCVNFKDAEHPGPDPSSPYEYSPNARSKYGDNYDAEVFWISFSEIYLWPCIEYFSSWDNLIEKLDTYTDKKLEEISQCMVQSNKWRKFEADTNLCWALKEVEKNEKRYLNANTYEESLQELYGVQELFPGIKAN